MNKAGRSNSSNAAKVQYIASSSTAENRIILMSFVAWGDPPEHLTTRPLWSHFTELQDQSWTIGPRPSGNQGGCSLSADVGTCLQPLSCCLLNLHFCNKDLEMTPRLSSYHRPFVALIYLPHLSSLFCSTFAKELSGDSLKWIDIFGPMHKPC